MTDLSGPKKSLGQHWLNDASILAAICDAVNVNSNDTILEIGPGQGSLTKILVSRAKQVVAVELDGALTDQLSSRVAKGLSLSPNQVDQKLRVVQGDVLEFDLTTLPKDYKVVANIPYYLTNKLLRTLCESTNPFKGAALLVQKEVAQRVVAGPGDMSILAISVQFYCQASLGPLVEAKLFTPPPKVDSQVLVLTRRNQPLFDVNIDSFFRIVKAGFSSKRKTLLNSLSGGLQLDKTVVQKNLDLASVSSSLRAQELSLENWHNIYKTFSQ